MKAFWQWVGSPGYWELAATTTVIFLTIAVLGKTSDWMFTAAILFGFYLWWKFFATAIQSKLKENKNG
jgi:tryptophan-rich sensory protein